jgi:DUF4097 and DUF4098 domain-containing protein YvlB
MKKILLLFFLLLIPFLSLKAEDEPTLQMDRTFNTTPGLRLDYNGNSGDVIITTWDKSEANIKVYANQNATENVEIQLVDGNGGINIKESSKYKSGHNHDIKLRYEISLPWNYNVYIKSSSSDYIIENLSGSVKVNTASGDGSLSNINGPVNIVSASGDIFLETINGVVKVNSASGDISGANINGISDIRTASGDITLKVATDYVKIISTSGEVVYLTGDFTPGASITTTSGDINVILSESTTATVTVNLKERLSGYYDNEKYSNSQDYNGGGNLIECKTKSGDISVIEGNDY